MSAVAPPLPNIRPAKDNGWFEAVLSFGDFLRQEQGLFNKDGVLTVERLAVSNRPDRSGRKLFESIETTLTRADLNRENADALATDSDAADGYDKITALFDEADFHVGQDASVMAGFGMSGKRGNASGGQITKAIPFEMLGMILITLKTADYLGARPEFLIGDNINAGNPDIMETPHGAEALGWTKEYYVNAIENIMDYLRPGHRHGRDYRIIDGHDCERNDDYQHALVLVKRFHRRFESVIKQTPPFDELSHRDFRKYDWAYFQREAATLLMLNNDVKISWGGKPKNARDDSYKMSERAFDVYYKMFRTYLLNTLSENERLALGLRPLTCIYAAAGNSMPIDNTHQFIDMAPYYTLADTHGRLLLTQRDGLHDCVDILNKMLRREDGSFEAKTIKPNGEIKNKTLRAMMANAANIVKLVEAPDMRGEEILYDKKLLRNLPDNARPFYIIAAKVDTLSNLLAHKIDAEWEAKFPEMPPKAFLGMEPKNHLDAGCPKAAVQSFAWEMEDGQRIKRAIESGKYATMRKTYLFTPGQKSPFVVRRNAVHCRLRIGAPSILAPDTMVSAEVWPEALTL